MILPHLLRFVWPIIITGVVLIPLAIIASMVVSARDRSGGLSLLLALWLTPLAYPLLCWALFSWAGWHDERLAVRLRADGVEANATVTAVTDLGIEVNVNPLIQLELRVAPPDAGPFTAEVFMTPSRLSMHRLQPGTVLRVRYDSKDHSRLLVEK